MTDEEIFDLAERHGWMDDFGRWNFKDDGLIKFALAIKTAEERETEKQEQKTPLKVLGLTVFTENRLRNGRVYDVETLQAMTNRDILAIPDMGKKALGEVLDALNAYAIDMSEKNVRVSDKWAGLTDDEVFNIYKQFDTLQYKSFAKAIEAKLKEKNA